MLCTATLKSGAPCPHPAKTADGVCRRHARCTVMPTCPVCLETIRTRAAVHALTKCGHTFHKRCVLAWLRRRGGVLTCPVCRAPCLDELRAVRHRPVRERLAMVVRTLPPPPGAPFAVYLTGLLTTPSVQAALDIDDATVQRLIDVAFSSDTDDGFWSSHI